jgi:uncharacterized protein (UPF0297 family)
MEQTKVIFQQCIYYLDYVVLDVLWDTFKLFVNLKPLNDPDNFTYTVCYTGSVLNLNKEEAINFQFTKDVNDEIKKVLKNLYQSRQGLNEAVGDIISVFKNNSPKEEKHLKVGGYESLKDMFSNIILNYISEKYPNYAKNLSIGFDKVAYEFQYTIVSECADLRSGFVIKITEQEFMAYKGSPLDLIVKKIDEAFPKKITFGFLG